MSVRDQSTLSSSAFLGRLRALVDARLGLPIRTHRPPPLRTVVIAAKKAFRLLAQPLINEAMAKQVAFNQELVEWSQAITNDLEALERSMVAMRAGSELRIRKLEGALAQLERGVDSGPSAPVTELIGAHTRRSNN